MNNYAHMRVSAFDVVCAVVEPDMPYFVHRGPKEMEHDSRHADCWCAPMRITLEEVIAHSGEELQAKLDQHFQVH